MRGIGFFGGVHYQQCKSCIANPMLVVWTIRETFVPFEARCAVTAVEL